MIEILFLLIYLFLVLGLGQGVLRCLRIAPEEPAAGLALAATFGLGVLSHALMALGFLGLLRTPWVLGVLACLSALALVSVPQVSSGLRRVAVSFRGRGPAEVLLWAFVLAHVGLLFVRTVAPPTSPDAVGYHLALPKEYLALGAIAPRWDTYQTLWPQTVEMLHALGMLLSRVFSDGSLLLVHLYSALHLPLLVLGIVGLVREHLDPRAAVWAAVLAVCYPHVNGLTLDQVEIPTALATVAAFHALLCWLRGGTGRWLVAAGMAAGVACSIKPFGLVGAGALGLVLLVGGRRRCEGRPGAALGAAVLFGAVTVVVGCVWYVRNVILTGNPVWPTFYETFGGPHWSNASGEYWREALARRGSMLVRPGWLEKVLFPWYATMVRPGLYIQPIHPLLLALGVPALFLRSRPVAVAAGLLAVYTFGVAWCFHGAPNTRYLHAVIPLAAAVAGWSVVRLSTANRWLRVGLVALVLGHAAFSLAAYVVKDRGAIAIFLGRSTEERYLARKNPWMLAARRINEVLPGDARVFLFRTGGAYPLEREYVLGAILTQFVVPFDTLRTPEALRARLLDLGVTHVALRRWSGEDALPCERGPVALVDAVVEAHGRLVLTDEASETFLYRLEGAP